jgi:hypothetical protein
MRIQSATVQKNACENEVYYGMKPSQISATQTFLTLEKKK